MRVSLLTLACCAALCAQTKSVAEIYHVPVPMRDGVRLYANVFRPSVSGRFPVILVRTPYGKGEDLALTYRFFVDHGYAFVIQDVRGRYESEGVFKPLAQEPADGDDTINWIARQPWSDGKVGMVGGSYLGIVQWKAALTNNQHLKAISPVVSGDDDYRDRFYSTGGAMKLGYRLLWFAENLKVPGFVPDFNKFVRHLPLRAADIAATGQPVDVFQHALDHPSFDSFWRAVSTREQMQKIRIPAFSFGGWYDNFVEGDLEAYSALRKTSGLNRLVVGPWPHNMSYRFPGVDFGPDSSTPVRLLQLQWFDHWLKGKDAPIVSAPPLKIFVMGADRWREFREWPPEGARVQSLYLESKGRANTLGGDGKLGSKPNRRNPEDTFVFDPNDPVPTRGGAVCCNPLKFPWGPMDQRTVEQRQDVLVYTTRPLKKDLEAVGPVRVVLYAATSARDTDFTAKLVDVFPDGSARNLTDGILRLRYRQSLERPVAANPGEIYRIAIDAGVTGNVFRRGHRIRLEISSSNFPRFDRNPNTGGPVAEALRLVRATQTVYHDRERPSELQLQVLP